MMFSKQDKSTGTLLKQKFFKQHVPAIVAFSWYVSLFPGRLPFDSADAIRMLQKGDSTEQWTPIFFWFLKFTTFNGQFIWLTSALICIGLFFSIKHLSSTLAYRKGKEFGLMLLVVLNPIYGFYSVTVSHDSTFLIGFILVISILVRFHENGEEPKYRELFLTLPFLLTSWLGYILVCLFIFALIKLRRKALIATGIAFLFAYISPIGLTATRSDVAFRPFLVDMKCVAQHPESRISQTSWTRMKSIAPEENWKSPLSCASMDKAVNSLYSSESNLDDLEWKKLMPTYLQLATDNPAIVLMGHIQRSSIALPPLLFQPPQNQVSWNLSEPVGLDTNTMLQQGPEVIHPSVDEESVDVNYAISGFFELPAQLLGFLINQASWFWGWGGLWLLPILFYSQKYLKQRKAKFWVLALFFSFHTLLFSLMPDPTPRYVLPTLVVGQLLLPSMIFQRTRP